jgi:tetraacyldisaccharide 4'-kinase
MRAPGFWWDPAPGLAAAALAPFGALYGIVAARRMARPGRPAAVPVVCVGNLVAGGAGKTPTALALAALLQARGGTPAFLTRGYGGRLGGPLVVEPDRHGAAEVGDEALLLAAAAPTIVARDRPAGAALAASIGADIIVMDDGLQNPSLAKDVAFAVVDAAVGIGNGRCLPAGPLRAPLAAQFAQVRELVLVGEGRAGEAVAARAAAHGRVVHRARLVPDPAVAARLAGRRVLAFAGIGRPDKFADTLREIDAKVIRLVPFADHHGLEDREARALLAAAKAENLAPVTTEKDAARLGAGRSPALRALREAMIVLPVTLRFDAPDAVAAELGQPRFGARPSSVSRANTCSGPA